MEKMCSILFALKLRSDNSFVFSAVKWISERGILIILIHFGESIFEINVQMHTF